jgi:hypothetical protein
MGRLPWLATPLSARSRSKIRSPGTTSARRRRCQASCKRATPNGTLSFPRTHRAASGSTSAMASKPAPCKLEAPTSLPSPIVDRGTDGAFTYPELVQDADLARRCRPTVRAHGGHNDGRRNVLAQGVDDCRDHFCNAGDPRALTAAATRSPGRVRCPMTWPRSRSGPAASNSSGGANRESSYHRRPRRRRPARGRSRRCHRRLPLRPISEPRAQILSETRVVAPPPAVLATARPPGRFLSQPNSTKTCHPARPSSRRPSSPF